MLSHQQGDFPPSGTIRIEARDKVYLENFLWKWGVGKRPSYQLYVPQAGEQEEEVLNEMKLRARAKRPNEALFGIYLWLEPVAIALSKF